MRAEQPTASGPAAARNRDPFDRMLAAQPLLEYLDLVSNDAPFNANGVGRLW
jgi:PIN domain nuclease of toxin-antitoxin system